MEKTPVEAARGGRETAAAETGSVGEAAKLRELNAMLIRELAEMRARAAAAGELSLADDVQQEEGDDGGMVVDDDVIEEEEPLPAASTRKQRRRWPRKAAEVDAVGVELEVKGTEPREAGLMEETPPPGKMGTSARRDHTIVTAATTTRAPHKGGKPRPEEEEKLNKSGNAMMLLLSESVEKQGQVAILTDELPADADAGAVADVERHEVVIMAATEADASLRELLEAADVEKRRALELLGAKDAKIAELEKQLREMNLSATDHPVEQAHSADEAVEAAGKKQQQQPKKKKKAPAPLVQAQKAAAAAAEEEKAAPVAHHEPEAAQGPGGRPRRNRKPNSRYPKDTYVVHGHAAGLRDG